MTGNRLYKFEKLCSKTAIDSLFAKGAGAYEYPLRAMYRFVPTKNGYHGAKFLITVPKKKMRHAVDRVLLRRRIREAYRLNRELLLPSLCNKEISVEIAFIYLSSKEYDYHRIDDKMKAILSKIADTDIAK